jgi:hypothetical protein
VGAVLRPLAAGEARQNRQLVTVVQPGSEPAETFERAAVDQERTVLVNTTFGAVVNPLDEAW